MSNKSILALSLMVVVVLFMSFSSTTLTKSANALDKSNSKIERQLQTFEI